MTPGLSRRSTVDAQDDILGMPVLASIPTMRSPRERQQQRRRRRMAWAAAAVVAVILVVAAFVVFT